jgi:Uncharacterised nucleotidyltransferase
MHVCLHGVGAAETVTTAQVDRLVGLSAGTAIHRAREQEQTKRLLSTANWDRLSETLGSLRLLPTLGPRLIEMVDGSVPETFERRVLTALQSSQRHAAFLELTTQRMIEMLRQAGIRVTPLKGPRLAEALYGDIARRPCNDIDLLVAPSQLDDAVRVVRALGYGQPADRVDGRGLPRLHFTLTHQHDALPPLELHWRIHWYEQRFAEERLLAPAGAPADWRPEAVDELAALLLFYARDGFLALRYACDLGAWWDIRGEQVAGGQMEQLIDTYPALAGVLRAALAVAESNVGLPTEKLGGQRLQPRARERLSRRIACAENRGGAAQRYAEMGLIDGLLTPRRGLREYLSRQLRAPQPAAGGTRLARLCADVAHSARVLTRYGLTVLGLLRGQNRGVRRTWTPR